MSVVPIHFVDYPFYCFPRDDALQNASDSAGDTAPPEDFSEARQEQAKMIAVCIPSLEHIKPLVIGKNVQLGHAYFLRSSPLVTYTSPSEQEVRAVDTENVETLRAQDGIELVLPATAYKWVKETTTTFKGGVLSSSVRPWENLVSMLSFKAYVENAMINLSYTFLDLWFEQQRRTPSAIVKIPLSELRVRDVVLCRYLKAALEEVGIAHVTVRTDNLTGLARKESASGSVYAACAKCLKVDDNHKRCGACKVAYYCSAACQKENWSKHKAECKTAQEGQKDINKQLKLFGFKEL